MLGQSAGLKLCLPTRVRNLACVLAWNLAPSPTQDPSPLKVLQVQSTSTPGQCANLGLSHLLPSHAHILRLPQVRCLGTGAKHWSTWFKWLDFFLLFMLLKNIFKKIYEACVTEPTYNECIKWFNLITLYQSI